MPHALISVSDKTGVAEFCRGLVDAGYSLLSTGGTAKALVEAGLDVTDVGDFTGFPEMMSGRLKTLHPKIHGGILGRIGPDHEGEDAAVMAEHGLEPIDLVVCVLYRFEETIAKPGVTPPEAIEQIDVGGPTMVRAAAKNHQRVGVVSAVDQYDAVLAAVREGRFDATFRRRLAAAAFERTASYDRAIADYMATLTVESEDDAADSPFPKVMTATFVDATPLRYGENPHQPAVVYKSPRARADDLTTANVRHGKELSYNNLLDLDAALNLVRDLPTAGAAVLKHNNPCGAGTAETASEAFLKAYSGDPVSAFGSIIALNVPVDVATAEALCEPGRFVECLLAPSFEDAAFELLTTKPTWRKNVRLVELPGLNGDRPPRTVLRQITGGVLAQTADEADFNFDEWKCVTEREPTDAELRDLKFAWAVCRHVKSNAIVFAKDGLATGVGAGQMSRLDSVEIAAKKSDGRAEGGAAASDAFFPFRDGLDQCAAAGVTAVVHPGGSKRDDEVIAAANEHGIAMLLTGVRHFRH